MSIDRIVASPYVRAQQTAELMSNEFECSVETYNGITPEGDPKKALNWLSELEHKSTAVVTHNPFVSYLLSLLVDGNFDVSINMPTASVACVEHEVIGIGTGSMDWFYDPASQEA